MQKYQWWSTKSQGGDGHTPSDAKGYALVFACNAATAAYLACIARVGKHTGLNAFGLMWCNGVMAAPVLAAVALLDGDAAKAAAYVRRSASAETDFEEAAAAAATGLVPGSGSGSGVAGSVASPSPYPGGGPGPGGLFFALVLASCALAFGLNYAIFLNTAVNSALTQTVCGNLKDVAVIAIGFNAFGGVRVDPRNVAGMGLASKVKGGASPLPALCAVRTQPVAGSRGRSGESA